MTRWLNASLDAERFVRGDRSGAVDLKAILASWRDNQDRFAAAAAGNPQLEAALPISADIDAPARDRNPWRRSKAAGRSKTDWRGRAKELLDRHTAAEKAQESIIKGSTMQQPPADLLISIPSGVRKLVEAALVAARTLAGYKKEGEARQGCPARGAPLPS
jgi:hexosaminidase